MVEHKYPIWLDGKLVEFDTANLHVLSHGLHYGSGVFEGIRAYEVTAEWGERVAGIFRLEDHTKRFFFSAATLGIKIPFSEDEINTAIKDTVRASGLTSCYIRPLVTVGTGKLGIKAKDNKVNVVIACWPWGAYLNKAAVDVVTSSLRRISPKSLRPEAKVAGYYVNSILALQDIEGTQYDEVVMLDDEGFVAEGSAENIFFIKGTTLYTPQRGSILPGITRQTIMDLAPSLGLTVVEKKITPEEGKTMDEMFLVGTACEVAPVASWDGQKYTTQIASAVAELYRKIVNGQRESQWISLVEPLEHKEAVNL